MKTESSGPSAGRPFLRALISSAMTAAFLNLAASLLDHPRAFESPAALVLPFLAGFAAWLVLAALVLGGLGRVGRWLGLEPASLRAALALALVLAAGLSPPVEVVLRDASSERAAVVWSLAVGLVLASATACHALAGRAGEGLRRAARLAPVPAALALLALWLVEYGPPRAPAARPPPARPGAAHELPPVLLITVDTLRADRVLGNGPRVPTPALDELAADSVVFENARAAAPWTKPSLATILTGLSPLVHGTTTRRARLPAGVETLAERLRAAGYATAGLGLNAHLEPAFAFDQGFDEYRFPARLEHGIALGAKLLERLDPARFPELFPSTEAIADAAVEWLRAQRQRPFFLWVHVLDPHWPYEPPAAWLEQPAREPRVWGAPATVTDVQAGNTKLGARDRERVSELYAGEIRYVDAQIARLIATLRELDLYQDALVVLASDHGEEFWEHGRYEHGHTLYDEVLRVPLLFKLPGDGPRARLGAAVTTEALVPTVLDVLGVAHEPADFGQASLRSWWQAPEKAAEAALFATGTYYFGQKECVVFEGMKLVLELDTGRIELFDLDSDPRELVSLSSARRADVERGLALLADWRARSAARRAALGLREADEVEPGDELRRLLESLGYAGDERP
jgi:arylsulfatase A-like enzyme